MIRAAILILTCAALTGCAGLGDLCAAANGYQVISPTGQVTTIVPMKCAVLRGVPS